MQCRNSEIPVLVGCSLRTVNYVFFKMFEVQEQLATSSCNVMHCSISETPVLVVLCSVGTVTYLFFVFAV